MKKVLAICIMMVLVMSLGFAASAEGFVSSPSSAQAPEIVDFKPAADDCTARLVITPYGDKEELTDTLEKLLEKANGTVFATKDLTALNKDLATLASSSNIKGEDLAVSTLFDIHVTGCDFHDGHVDFDVTLSADLLEHFVGLLHMNKNGEWELVKDAKVTNNGEHLQFSVESFSPFAVVVDTSDLAPQTGDSSNIWIYVAVMAVAAALIIVLLFRIKKRSV